MKKKFSILTLIGFMIVYIIMAPKIIAAEIKTEELKTKGKQADVRQEEIAKAAEKLLDILAFTPTEEFKNMALGEEPLDIEVEAVAVEAPIEEEPAKTDDLYWLSRVIQAEAGSSWMPDWLQQAVGSVVLNRVSSDQYPDTIEDVIFDEGQYSCVTNGSIYEEPSEKAIENAQYILEHGSILPVGVVGQSEFIQGEVHEEYYDKYLGTTTYFCYIP
ncbi:cell wall hydrolase [Scatolibacter rhodanostii]|uniref:cell wall hydrolase n=1 Tax=Scatolibacter rhodanostii TaxID=2014781 RepID=UPI000C07FE8D|nr:cell wall hydrolase [Scatolibacter rhodanostii]